MNELDFDILEDDIIIPAEDFPVEDILPDFFPKSKKAPKHYVNNADFCEALVKYKLDVAECQELNLPKPQIPNYIGECFIKIAEGVAKKPNFFNYSYKMEFISDSIENCLMGFENFDVNKSQNPFSYFTQIIFFCFLRRIAKEQKQQYIKYKATESFGILDEFELQDLGGSEVAQIESYENIYDFIKKYEEKMFKKPINVEKSLVPKGLDFFMDDL
jgi:hypothetical protein